MLVATWNINGVKARLDALSAWLDECQPDVACLQEIKSVDEAFPRTALEAKGWHVETHGQKGFNGVALISKQPPQSVVRGLRGDDSDEQARYIEGVWNRGSGSLRIASLYLPNGNPLGTEKFDYKLRWMARLEAHAKRLLADEAPFLLAGDYNIIPEPADAKNPNAWVNDALYQPESRSAYRRLLSLGLVDALRSATDKADTYTFWDYQAGAWQRNNGIRIDHVLMSPEVAARFASANVDKHVRAWEKPSDHVPVVVQIGFD